MTTDAELGLFVRTHYTSLISFWDKAFWQYQSKNDMPARIAALKSGIEDAATLEYINKFVNLLELCKVKNDILVKNSFAYTRKDAEFQQNYVRYVKGLKQ